MNTNETKELILLKTFGLLLSKGYDLVSISDIQRETGMARGLLYHYFGSKKVLFEEVTTKYFIDMFNIDIEYIKAFDLEQMISYVTDKYRNISAQSWERFGISESVGILNYDFLFYRVVQQSPEFEKRYLLARSHEVAAWEIVLRNTAIAGRLREDLELARVAHYFVYLMDGVWMNAVNGKLAVSLMADLNRTLSDYAHLLYR